MFTLFFPTLFATSFPGFSPTLPTEREILKKKLIFTRRVLHFASFSTSLLFKVVLGLQENKKLKVSSFVSLDFIMIL